MIQLQYCRRLMVNQGFGVNMPEDAPLTPAEIERRRDDAIRRALNTPPTPAKQLVGKGKRTQSKRKRSVKKATRSKPKGV
jgi:hypothetical protein